ncbi:MAG: hypothetical protein LBR60_05205 [Fibrobacter sp.]|jgi:hypothetical protein|nr:hypothetical protein [Fibrobacter sp.]
MKGIRFFGLLLTALILASCASFRAVPPENFAAYKESKEDGTVKFKAISPDGVLYRVSEYEQESEASAEFWGEALLLKMKNSNYKQEETLTLTIGNQPAAAYLFSLASSTGTDFYLIAAVQSKGKVFVVEAAGEEEKFNARKTEILEAIGKIEF